jgi:hypothetical protein
VTAAAASKSQVQPAIVQARIRNAQRDPMPTEGREADAADRLRLKAILF